MMNLGAEPKKVGLLALLVVVAIYFLVFNPFADNGASSGQQSKSAPPPMVNKPSPAVVSTRSKQTAAIPGYAGVGPKAPPSLKRSSARGERVLQDFRPSLKPKRPEDAPDPMTQDPTLLTGILAKLQTVKVEGAHRNLFNWGTGQPVNVGKGTLLAKDTRPVPNPLAGRMIGPEEPPKPVPPSPPPPPPAIPLKFYGYVTNAANKGPRRAFFLEGDDIHVVNEGDTVKRRYRIVRIGVNSVVVEDTDFHSQQTLPLEEAPG